MFVVEISLVDTGKEMSATSVYTALLQKGRKLPLPRCKFWFVSNETRGESSLLGEADLCSSRARSVTAGNKTLLFILLLLIL